MSAGALSINGGQLIVDHDAAGLNAGAILLSKGGQIAVGRNLAGGNVGSAVNLDTASHIDVGNDVTAPIVIGEGLSLKNGATVSVGRDLAGLTVNGNLTVDPTGGKIRVGGNLTGLSVDGVFQGQKSKSAVDLEVGLNLQDLRVRGGAANAGSIEGANILVGKNLVGINVEHGLFNSFVTAGVLIDGGNQAAGSFGADGPDAIYNSQLLAGTSINNLTVNGNVRSTFAVDPKSTGYPTRIVAGMGRDGTVTTGGSIDRFQILGTLYDSVLAASVAPSGGNGTLPTFAYGSGPRIPDGTPGDGTYDAPAGVIVGGTTAVPVRYPNYSELSYYNETLTGVSYDTNQDSVIDDFILPGSINGSFASNPADLIASNVTAVTLALPTKSTVLGGVVSTVHDSSADFAGIFAANTSGVFIGSIPS